MLVAALALPRGGLRFFSGSSSFPSSAPAAIASSGWDDDNLETDAPDRPILFATLAASGRGSSRSDITQVEALPVLGPHVRNALVTGHRKELGHTAQRRLSSLFFFYFDCSNGESALRDRTVHFRSTIKVRVPPEHARARRWMVPDVAGGTLHVLRRSPTCARSVPQAGVGTVIA